MQMDVPEVKIISHTIHIDAFLTKRPGFVNIEIHHSELQGKHVLIPGHDGNYTVMVDEEGPCFLFLARDRMASVTAKQEGKTVNYRVYAGEHWRYELKREGQTLLPIILNNTSFSSVLIELYV